MSKKVTPKDEALAHWRNVEPGQNPLPLMNAIPYRAAGSKYGACGVRIDGTPEFVDAVLSNLKELINGENGKTRLELCRRSVGPVEINGQRKGFANREEGSEVCYIRLHERGRESQIMHIMLEAHEAQVAAENELPEGIFE